MADEIKQTVLIDIDIEQDEADFRKLANLKGALVGLKKEQKDLNDALKAGTITQKEYNSEIVRVEALQKRTAAQYNQTQRAVTGLKNPLTQINDSLKKQNQAIQGVLPGLDRMTGGAISAGGAIFGMVKASLAFLATPIGLAFAALAALLLPVISYLKNTGEGADILTREMEGLKAVVEVAGDEINSFGKKTFDFFKKVLASNPQIGVLIDTYNALADAGREYADALDEIQDAREDASIANTKEENEIKRLLLQAKNRTLAEQDRIDLLEKALALESTRVSRVIGSAQDELSAIVQRNEARIAENTGIKRLGETQQEFVENNIKAIRAFDEPLAKSLIKAVDDLEKARASGITIEEKAQNQLDAIRDKAEEKEKKRQEERFKRSEQEREQRIRDYDAKLEQEETQLISDQEKADFDAELDQIIKTGFEERLKTHEDNKKKILQNALKFEREVIDARINLLGNFGTAIQLLAGKNKFLASAGIIIERAAAIASVISNLGIANFKAVAMSPQTLGQPLVGLNTATAVVTIGGIIAQAAQSISQINSAKFARGGYTGRGTMWEPAGIVHKGEVVWSQADVARAGGAEAVDKMRPTYRKDLMPYAVGGIVGNETRLATQHATSQFDINQMAGLINQIQTVLVYEHFQAKAAEVESLQRRATVIS